MITALAQRPVQRAVLNRYRRAHVEAASERRELAAQVYRTMRGRVLAMGQYDNARATRLRDNMAARGGSSGSHLDWWTLDRLRRQSRDLYRNNSIARGMIERLVDLIVGPGYKLQAKTEDKKWNRLVERRFTAWQPDYTLAMSLGELTRAAMRQVLVDGDCLGLWAATPDGDAALQMVDGERLVGPDGVGGTGMTSYTGIETDAGGRPQGYWVAPYTADGSCVDRARAVRSEASAVLFLSRPRFFSQLRGEPVMAACIDRYDQADSIVESTVTAMHVAACVALIIKTERPDITMEQMAGATAATSRGAGEADAVGDEWELEPGTKLHLKPGESADQFAPQHPNQQFGDMLRMMVRLIGMDMGLPLELAMLDTKESNFSAGRMVGELAMRGIDATQQWLIGRLLSPLYRMRVGSWLDGRELALPDTRPDDWDAHRWQPPAKPQFDPEKQARADVEEVKAGFSTWTEKVMARGRDPEEVAEERAHEIAMQAAMGMVQQGVRSSGEAVAALSQDNVGEVARATADELESRA